LRVKSTNTTYAFLSPNLEGASTREFALNATVTGFVAPRGYGEGAYVFDSLPRKDGFNILALGDVDYVAAEATLLLGKLPYDRAGKFDSQELAKVGTYSLKDGDLPLGDPHFGWFGDIGGFIGGTTLNAEKGYEEIGLLFFDTEGRVVGKGKLPGVVAPPPANFTQRTFRDFAAGLSGGLLDPKGATFHVAWSDVSEGPTGSHVNLGFASLVCTAVQVP
jgi:hypothetical protein